MTAFRLADMIEAFQFVLDTPKCYGKSPNGQQRTDATGVPPHSLWVMAKSGAARYFESVKIVSPPFNRSLPFDRSWRTAAHAYAHHNHKEKVFGEWVFIYQGAIPFSPHKGKQGKSFLSSHPVARGNIQFSPLLK